MVVQRIVLSIVYKKTPVQNSKIRDVHLNIVPYNKHKIIKLKYLNEKATQGEHPS